MRRATRSGPPWCLLVLLSLSCRGTRPEATASPSAADFLSISPTGASAASRWSDVRVTSDSRGFRTDLFAKTGVPGGADVPAELRLTLIRLSGPGTYRLGFGWDRGQSRATVLTGAGTRCMTPGSDAGTVEITAAGERLEGRFHVRCFPDGDTASGQQAREFSGAFSVTMRNDAP